MLKLVNIAQVVRAEGTPFGLVELQRGVGQHVAQLCTLVWLSFAHFQQSVDDFAIEHGTAASKVAPVQVDHRAQAEKQGIIAPGRGLLMFAEGLDVIAWIEAMIESGRGCKLVLQFWQELRGEVQPAQFIQRL